MAGYSTAEEVEKILRQKEEQLQRLQVSRQSAGSSEEGQLMADITSLRTLIGMPTASTQKAKVHI